MISNKDHVINTNNIEITAQLDDYYRLTRTFYLMSYQNQNTRVLNMLLKHMKCTHSATNGLILSYS